MQFKDNKKIKNKGIVIPVNFIIGLKKTNQKIGIK